MALEQNIKAILECNFSIARDEVIEAATKRIMEQIERQNPVEDIKAAINLKSKIHNDGDYYIKTNDVLKILDSNINSKKSCSIVDVESIVSALEREEYAEENKSEQTDTEFNHESFYEFLLNVVNPNEMEKYRSMFLSSGEAVN